MHGIPGRPTARPMRKYSSLGIFAVFAHRGSGSHKRRRLFGIQSPRSWSAKSRILSSTLRATACDDRGANAGCSVGMSINQASSARIACGCARFARDSARFARDSARVACGSARVARGSAGGVACGSARVGRSRARVCEIRAVSKDGVAREGHAFDARRRLDQPKRQVGGGKYHIVHDRTAARHTQASCFFGREDESRGLNRGLRAAIQTRNRAFALPSVLSYYLYHLT